MCLIRMFLMYGFKHPTQANSGFLCTGQISGPNGELVPSEVNLPIVLYQYSAHMLSWPLKDENSYSSPVLVHRYLMPTRVPFHMLLKQLFTLKHCILLIMSIHN